MGMTPSRSPWRLSVDIGPQRTAAATLAQRCSIKKRSDNLCRGGFVSEMCTSARGFTRPLNGAARHAACSSSERLSAAKTNRDGADSARGFVLFSAAVKC